jgi:hypothetical protein
LGYPVPGGNKYRNLALRVEGSLKNRDNKLCSLVPWDSDLRRLLWRCPAKTEKCGPDFSSERAPHINKPETVKKKIKWRMGKIGRRSQMGV